MSRCKRRNDTFCCCLSLTLDVTAAFFHVSQATRWQHQDGGERPDKRGPGWQTGELMQWFDMKQLEQPRICNAVQLCSSHITVETQCILYMLTTTLVSSCVAFKTSFSWSQNGAISYSQPRQTRSSPSPALSFLHIASMEKDKMTQIHSRCSNCPSLRKTCLGNRFPYVNTWISFKPRHLGLFLAFFLWVHEGKEQPLLI